MIANRKARTSQQQLLRYCEEHHNGISPNVRDNLNHSEYRNQIQARSNADAVCTLIGKFTDPQMDLSPAGIDNHAMGTVFIELPHKSSEQDNHEAGKRNSGFMQFARESALPFGPNGACNTAALDDRQDRYCPLAEQFWNPNRRPH